MIHFSIEQFFQVFADYNRAVFPLQAALVLLALGVAVLAAKPFSSSNKIASLFLAFLWLWMGVAYHLVFFSKINSAAFLFATLFIVQGSLFFHKGVVRNCLDFQARRGLHGIMGLVLILYALIAYPILGYAHGETYPFMPTFGVPCPTTIFTFGILLWTTRTVSPFLLIIPFLWSLIGVYAAIAFGIKEDFGLPIAGIITVAMLSHRGYLNKDISKDGSMNIEDKIKYETLPLFAHDFLTGVPMTSLYRLNLPGGPSGMTVLDIKESIGFNTEELEAGFITKSLFWVRGLIGGVFGWDEDEELTASVSFVARLTDEERGRSRIEPGKKEGISRVLYCFENEFAAEIINRTVHCFWVMAKEQTANGYTLYTAVYVRKLNWFTPIYMALVTPMLKWIIYPALNKSVIRNWNDAENPKTRKLAHV